MSQIQRMIFNFFLNARKESKSRHFLIDKNMAKFIKHLLGHPIIDNILKTPKVGSSFKQQFLIFLRIIEFVKRFSKISIRKFRGTLHFILNKVVIK